MVVRHEIPDDVPEHAFAAENGAVHVPALIADAFGRSRSEARRMLAQGAVRLDGEPLADVDVDGARLDGRVLQVGKRHFRRVRIA